MDSQVWKLVQKRVYDLLSHRYGLLVVLGGVILIIVSAFHFGEALLEWSHEKYAAVFNSYSDNLASRTFRERLCLPVPIDAVYTWVNGSDPQLILQLHKVKMNMEEQLNLTRPGQCTYSNCVPSPVVIVEGLAFTELNIKKLKAAFQLNISSVFNYTSPTSSGKTESLALVLPSWEQAKAVSGQTHQRDKTNFTLTQAFYTSDTSLPHGTAMGDKLLMTGFPYEYSSENILSVLPEEHRKHIAKVEVHSEKGVAVLHMRGSKEVDSLLQLKNFTIEGKHPAFTVAYMVSDLTDLSRDGDVASSRFEDNEELRYSLRSLERFAPWIRHVFIVTNGQIPYWLNLDSPRISVITHEEIFPNKSHLPTFSSPSIEAHLHRIPGLSNKFLYFNDDVMFGSEVWPDDFFSYATGQKLYLTWPVPSCNEGCPANWIRDGYCDKACNSSECEWDGGDCSDYCNPGCANNWIADKYCDQACNHLVCGFDAGDCGTSNYHQMFGLDLHRESKTAEHYIIPGGETLAYFNLTQVLDPNGKVTAANHLRSDAVRAAAVSNKYRVLTLILYPKRNATKLTFHMEGHRNGVEDKFQLNFTVSVDPSAKSIAKKKVKEQVSQKLNTSDEDEKIVLFEEYPKDILNPHAEKAVFQRPGSVHFPFNISSNLTLLGLSPGLEKSLSELMVERSDGDFTEKGFELALAMLYQQFEPEIRAWKFGMKIGLLENINSLRGLSKNSSKRESNPVRQPDFPNLQRKLMANDNAHGELSLQEDGKEKLVQMEILEEDGHSRSFMTDEEFLNFLKTRGNEQRLGGDKGLPWEVQGVFRELEKRQKELQQAEIYEIDNRKGRQLLDTFGDSLRHVNRLYNKEFGFVSRKVPAHMPHMIDKHIMAELQAIFPAEWAVTSSHKVRSPDDMQFAFSYYYYVLGAVTPVDAGQVFEEMDTDHSGVLSDRELRTLATRLNELPIYLETLTAMENVFVNCSKHLSPDLEQKYHQQVLALPNEQYYVQEMPQITKLLFVNCKAMINQVRDKFKAKPKYRTTILDDSDVAFKMIHGNVSKVVGQLDDIRKNPKKFICLNDNIEHGTEEAKTVKAVVQDFYESLLPVPSQFELPREYRNRFLHMKDLEEWKLYRDWLRFWAHLALVVLVMFTIASYFGDKIEALQRKLARHRLCLNSRSSSANATASAESPAPAKPSLLLSV